MTNANEAQINLEHILPQQPRDEWKQAFLQNLSNTENIELETYIDRLGNMTLLDISINKKILEYSDWNPQNIEDRQTKMANIASKVWRIDI